MAMELTSSSESAKFTAEFTFWITQRFPQSYSGLEGKSSPKF
jgi:hypothetical protein